MKAKPIQPPTARQLIRAAVAAAGGAQLVADEFGLSAGAVSRWQSRGTLPSEHIHRLCRLGADAIKPEAIVEAIGRESEIHQIG